MDFDKRPHILLVWKATYVCKSACTLRRPQRGSSWLFIPAWTWGLVNSYGRQRTAHCRVNWQSYKLLGLWMFSPAYIQVHQQRAEILLSWGSTSGQSLANHRARANARNIRMQIKTGVKERNWVETSAVTQFEGDKFYRISSVKSLNNSKTNNSNAGNKTTSGEDQNLKSPAYII